jgi:hypothetical protein
MTRSRSEHLRWCKARALEYWRAGDLTNAVMSMGSDLDKHEETKIEAPYLLMLGTIFATKHDSDGVKRWIEGFR